MHSFPPDLTIVGQALTFLERFDHLGGLLAIYAIGAKLAAGGTRHCVAEIEQGKLD
jgi:hypothetical protein